MKTSAAKKVKAVTGDVIQGTIGGMRENEKRMVLVWSQKALAIRDDRALSKKEKIIALKNLDTPNVVKVLLPRVLEIIKNKLWVDQSWARRLGVLGFSIGGITFGGTAVGIATLGAGIGLPLMVLTAGGGVILGSVIDEIKKELK